MKTFYKSYLYVTEHLQKIFSHIIALFKKIFYSCSITNKQIKLFWDILSHCQVEEVLSSDIQK